MTEAQAHLKQSRQIIDYKYEQHLKRKELVKKGIVKFKRDSYKPLCTDIFVNDWYVGSIYDGKLSSDYERRSKVNVIFNTINALGAAN